MNTTETKKQHNTRQANQAHGVTDKPHPKTTRELEKEELERWRNESPAAGQVALAEKRNSAKQPSSDVTAQGWSAEDLAQESVYQDEATVKAQLKNGKKTVALHHKQ